MKKAIVFLKVASYLMILIGLMHSIGHFVQPPPANETEKQLLDLMKNYHILKPGALNRTMFEILRCFSWSFSLFSISMGVLGIFLLRQKIEAKILKKIFFLIFVFVSLFVVVNLRYSILVPIVLYGVSWLVYLIGLLLWPKN